MKRLILIIIFTIIISGCNNLSSNNQSNSYTLKKRHFVTIGIDIPAGIYCAKVLSEDNSSLIFSPVQVKRQCTDLDFSCM